MSKSKKFCIVSLGAYPLFNPECKRTFGGAEVQLYFLAQSLKRLGCEVDFVVGDFGQERVENYNSIRVIKSSSVSGRSGIVSFIRSSLILSRVLFSLNSDVFLQRSASAGTGLVRLISWLKRKKFVYMSAHEIDCNGEYEKQNNFIKGLLFRLGVRNADLVITQSVDHEKMLSDHHGVKSVVMPSMYPLDEQVENGIYKDTVLWVARCEDWKNPDLFLELAKSNLDVQFTMICPPSNNQPDFFEKIKSTARSAKNVTFIRFVPFEEIDAYFSRARLFVQTSDYEGFPNTFIQAFKNETPVLSFSVSPDSILERNNLGACADGDREIFFTEFQNLLNDREKLTQMGSNASAYFRKNHDSAVVAGRILDAINKTF